MEMGGKNGGLQEMVDAEDEGLQCRIGGNRPQKEDEEQRKRNGGKSGH